MGREEGDRFLGFDRNAFSEEGHMRFVQLTDGVKAGCRFVVLLLAGACTLLPMNLSAQEAGFLVLRSLKNYKELHLWTAQCSSLKISAPKQTVQCTLTQTTCAPGDCPFEKKSDDQPPVALTFGLSSYNPTCAWAFDWTRWTYVYRCW